MTEAKFTKGGWGRNIKPISKYPTIFAGRNTHIAVVKTDGRMPLEEAEANADLIVAGPKLFAALEKFLAIEFANLDEDEELAEAYTEGRKAINAALGKQSP